MKEYGDKDIIYTKDNCPVILNWITPNSRVLEFGPAFGYVTRYLKEVLNCSVVGVELNPDMAIEAGKYSEKMIIANLDDDQWDIEIEGRFDYILFMDVLEHLKKPQKVLMKAVKFGGCVLTSIPNIGHSSIFLSLLDREFEYKQLGLLDDTHIHFFTRKSIERMMDLCQMKCSDENSNILLYPSLTEFKKYYITHPFVAWSIIRTIDSSVYQFVNKWEVKSFNYSKQYEGFKISVFCSMKILIFDMILYFFDSNRKICKKKYIQKIWEYLK